MGVGRQCGGVFAALVPVGVAGLRVLAFISFPEVVAGWVLRHGWPGLTSISFPEVVPGSALRHGLPGLSSAEVVVA